MLLSYIRIKKIKLCNVFVSIFERDGEESLPHPHDKLLNLVKKLWRTYNFTYSMSVIFKKFIALTPSMNRVNI